MMLHIPSIKSAIILPPKTASRSIIAAVTARYPNDAYVISSHLEPYIRPQDATRLYCVVRDPAERLLSLYRYCQNVQWKSAPDRAAGIRKATEAPFDEWLRSDFYFTMAYERDHKHGTTVRIPDTRKSQIYWARPDLGTTIVRFDQLELLEAVLDINLTADNQATAPMPEYDKAGLEEWCRQWFAWDISVTR